MVTCVCVCGDWCRLKVASFREPGFVDPLRFAPRSFLCDKRSFLSDKRSFLSRRLGALYPDFASLFFVFDSSVTSAPATPGHGSVAVTAFHNTLEERAWAHISRFLPVGSTRDQGKSAHLPCIPYSTAREEGGKIAAARCEGSEPSHGVRA